MADERPRCAICGQPVADATGMPTRQGNTVHHTCAQARAYTMHRARESRAMRHLALAVCVEVVLVYVGIRVGLWILALLWLVVMAILVWQDRVYYGHLAKRKRRERQQKQKKGDGKNDIQ